MKILVLSSRIPYPLTAGFRIRIYNTAKYFKNAGYSVGLLYLSANKPSSDYERELKNVFDYVESVQMNKTESLWNLFKGIFIRQIPFQVALYKSGKFAERCRILSKEYDAVIANNVRVAEYAKPLSGIRKFLDLHDAVSYNYENAIKNAMGIKKMIYRTECKN
jgi:hypothetical protein